MPHQLHHYNNNKKAKKRMKENRPRYREGCMPEEGFRCCLEAINRTAVGVSNLPHRQTIRGRMCPDEAIGPSSDEQIIWCEKDAHDLDIAYAGEKLNRNNLEKQAQDKNAKCHLTRPHNICENSVVRQIPNTHVAINCSRSKNIRPSSKGDAIDRRNMRGREYSSHQSFCVHFVDNAVGGADEKRGSAIADL